MERKKRAARTVSRTEKRYGATTLFQYFETTESAPTVVQRSAGIGPASGEKVPDRRAYLACLKRSSWRAHMLAIRAWISAGSEARVVGISELMRPVAESSTKGCCLPVKRTW